MEQLINDVGAILKAPFVGPLDLTQLFLVVFMVIVFALISFMIVHAITQALREGASAIEAV